MILSHCTGKQLLCTPQVGRLLKKNTQTSSALLVLSSIYRLTWLQFCRSGWNTPDKVRQRFLCQLGSDAWTCAGSVSPSYGTFLVQFAWWLFGVFNLMTGWSPRLSYKIRFHQYILIKKNMMDALSSKYYFGPNSTCTDKNAFEAWILVHIAMIGKL